MQEKNWPGRATGSVLDFDDTRWSAAANWRNFCTVDDRPAPTRKTESAVERSVNFHTKLRRRCGRRLLRPKEKRHIDTQSKRKRERERERESGSVTRIFPILVKKYFIRRGEEHDAVSDGTALLQSAFWILIPLQRRLHIYVFDRLISFIWHFIDTTLQNYRSKDLFAVIIQFLDSTLWRDGWQHFFCQWDSS